jgi:hypothetical protein
MAGWQSGYAAACKAVYAGSIPASASINQVINIFNSRQVSKKTTIHGFMRCIIYTTQYLIAQP